MHKAICKALVFECQVSDHKMHKAICKALVFEDPMTEMIRAAEEEKPLQASATVSTDES
jgi:hypothetical protein